MKAEINATLAGQTNASTRSYPDVLQKLECLEVLSNDDCGDYGKANVTANMLCAYCKGRSACFGDSGGE